MRELKPNEYVVFNINGKEYKAGRCEVVWSRRQNAFWITDENEQRIYSNDVRTKESKKARKNNAPMVNISDDIMTQTEKAYGLFDGTNNAVVKENRVVYYKWIAKSICEVKDGKVYAPVWAVK